MKFERRGTRARSKKDLTDCLLYFKVTAGEFFCAMRAFGERASSLRTLTRSVDDEDADCAEEEKKKRRRKRGAGAEYAEKKAVVDDDDDDEVGGGGGGKEEEEEEEVDLNEMRRMDRVFNLEYLRASFAYSKVIAKKFELFCKTHFCIDEKLGRMYCAFVWNAFLLTKTSWKKERSTRTTTRKRKGTFSEDATTKGYNNNNNNSIKLPNLYDQYHLLIAIEAFALMNAPPEVLRTSLENMLTMTERDEETNEPLALESLCKQAKTKLSVCEEMLKRVEKIHEEILKEKNTLRKRYFEKTKEKNRENNKVMENVSMAAAIFEREYLEAIRSAFGCRAINEKLYVVPFLLEDDESNDYFDCLKGDLSRGSERFSRTEPQPMSKNASFTFRTIDDDDDNDVEKKKNNFPPTPFSPFAFHKTVAGAIMNNNNNNNNVQNTPISSVIYGIEWMDKIISSAEENSQQQLDGEEDEKILRSTIEMHKLNEAYIRAKTVIANTTIANIIREDAFSSLNAAVRRGPVSRSLDAIVNRRAHEAFCVVKYFLQAILGDEIRRLEKKEELGKNNDAPTVHDSTKAALNLLVSSRRFVEVVVALSIEVVSVARGGVNLSSEVSDINDFPGTRAINLRFPAIPNAIGLHAFDVLNGIEPFVRSRPEMPREIRSHFGKIVETIIERLAWQKESTLYPLLRVCVATNKTSTSKNSGKVKPTLVAPPTKPESAISAVLLGNALTSGQKVTKPTTTVMSGFQSGFHTVRSLVNMKQFDQIVLGDDGSDDIEKKKAMEVAATALRSPARSTGYGPEYSYDHVGLDGKTIEIGGEGSAFSPLRMSADTAFTTPKKLSHFAGLNFSSSLDLQQQRQENDTCFVSSSNKDPLPDKYASTDEAEDENDDTNEEKDFSNEKRRAKASLDVFFVKVLRLASLRLADICARLHVSNEVTRNAFQLVEFVIYEKTSLLYARHLDMIVLSSIYGACKIAANEDDRNVKFKDIVYRYHKQPQATKEVFWSCPLTVERTSLEVKSKGDIITFYNTQFVPNMKLFLLQLRTTSSSMINNKDDDDELFLTPPSNIAASTPKRPSRANFDPSLLLKSPIREVKRNDQNGAGGHIYVSPMRPETRDRAFQHIDRINENNDADAADADARAFYNRPTQFHSPENERNRRRQQRRRRQETPTATTHKKQHSAQFSIELGNGIVPPQIDRLHEINLSLSKKKGP